MPTNAHNKIIGFIEDGLLDWEMVCRECLQRMSYDEIDDMIRECDWDDDDYDDDDDDDDDDP